MCGDQSNMVILHSQDVKATHNELVRRQCYLWEKF